ncbi:MAG: lytic transglycosylase domain-containing protein, partial [Alphaproteobacteria bacterium]|nr:lytic transglycosylase domain-containing protein [Alphaproteobacteria bacterium]
MTSRRSLRRWLFDCAIAAPLAAALALPSASAFAAPDEKPAKSASEKAKPVKPKADKKQAAKTKPAKKAALAEKTANKKAAKTEANKAGANKTEAKKTEAKPAKAATATLAPIPRPRPGMVLASAPNLPAGHLLGPVNILPTQNFALAPPAAAATAPAELPQAPAYSPPPPAKMAALPPAAPLVATESASTPRADFDLAKQAIDLVRRGRTGEATAVEKSISDPLARKLVEWTIVRSDENDAGFDRLAAFSNQNPSWPNALMIRKRAEGALWDERRSGDTVRAFFASSKPITAKGKFALARAMQQQGDAAGAAQLARQAWREDTCSAQVEKLVMEMFGDVLTRADHKARMDRRFYDDDPDAGMRMAQLLGGTDLLIGRARKAVVEKAANAKALLDAVPASARSDAGYLFHKAQWLRREDEPVEAARLLQAAPHNASQLHNLDEWWVERRLVARKLLDLGENEAAYQVARDALPPVNDNLRAEHEFTAGWIALRFVNNPRAAYQHFARVGEGTNNPITLARGEYWQGRAAEALGNNSAARTHYQAAAEYSTAYYGQIARARLGLSDLGLRRPPDSTHHAQLMNLEVVRAVQLLYAIDARDLVVPFVSDLADKAVDTGALVAVAEIARKNDDARAMLLIGKGALRRGYAFDLYAFPTNGIPQFRMVGPAVDKSVVFAIARQESAFNPKAISSAKA